MNDNKRLPKGTTPSTTEDTEGAVRRRTARMDLEDTSNSIRLPARMQDGDDESDRE